MTQENSHTKYIASLWFLLILGLLVIAGIFFMVSKTQMPDTGTLENPEYEYASIIYSDDMQELGRYYKFNREWHDFSKINPHLVDALIATEDERFYKHSGIDAKGTLRAFVYMGSKGGASTITQQLAKLFFTQKSSSFVKRVWQKLKEWVIAIQFEKRYTKQEILSMYLNKFDFLYNSHGIGAAAQTYFAKKQEELSLPECAVLIGMLKNPSLYNPKKYPENALKRRNVVMSQMVRNKLLTGEAYDSLKMHTLDNSKFTASTHSDGPAPYFRSTLTSYLKNLLNDAKYKKPDGSKYNIYQDGLKIYTTIDMGMQEKAERARNAHMKKIQKTYFDVWENKNPWTHDATEYQLKIRKDGLNRLVRECDRFLKLRTRYIAKGSQEILAKYPDAKLRDADILRMLKAEKDADYFRQLRVDGIISARQESDYNKILKDESWPNLKTQWDKLQIRAKSVFNKKAQMKVFSYDFEGHKDTIMTPMDSIKYHRMHLQLGSISIEPVSGEVKTWVGGIGHKFFKYDHVTSDRQVGSTFKPFLYTTAICHQAMSPCQKVRDVQYTIPAGDPNFKLMDSWEPANARGKFTGKDMTLLEGLKTSTNSISVWLMKQLGSVELVKDIAENMGIGKNKIPSAPSICLGTPELSVLEMTNAYSCFANDGNFTKAIFVTKIEDKDGKIIYTAIPEQRKVLSSKCNHAMIEMLKYAASSRASYLESEFGGKTGTTNDFVDGWFMGVTSNLVTGTWVGGEDPWIRFLSLDNGQGGRMARPFFLDFMQQLERDPNYNYGIDNVFIQPDSDDIIEMNCNKYNDWIKQNEPVIESDSLDKKAIKKAVEDEFDEEFEEG